MTKYVIYRVLVDGVEKHRLEKRKWILGWEWLGDFEDFPEAWEAMRDNLYGRFIHKFDKKGNRLN